MLARACAMLTAASVESVKTLVELLKPGYASMTRLSTARSVLEIGIKVRSLVEIEERMQELEKRILETSPKQDCIG